MAAQDSKVPQKSSNGYGKRSAWQWVLIYIVVAAVVYGLIYYVFFRGDGSSSGGGGGGLGY